MVALSVELQDSARADLIEAGDWYEARRQGLSREFIDEVRAASARIASAPKHYPAIYRDVRRVTVKRFPYNIYYRLLDDRIAVIAIAHNRRHQRTWRALL